MELEARTTNYQTGRSHASQAVVVHFVKALHLPKFMKSAVMHKGIYVKLIKTALVSDNSFSTDEFMTQ